ncbi:MAG: hypothetical protein QXQ02_00490 [Halobacteria archaeon]
MNHSSLSGCLILLAILIISISLPQSLAMPNEPVKLELLRPAGLASLPSYNLIPMVVGNGFAFAGDEFHIVKLNIIGIRKLAFHDLRAMITERKNLSQIKEALVKPEGITPTWKGYLKFGTKHYTLKVEEIDSKHLKAQILHYPAIAEIVESTAGIKPSVVGNLSMEIKFYEGTIVGTGDITFNSEVLGNNYKIYLYISPDRPFIEPLVKSVKSEESSQ